MAVITRITTQKKNKDRYNIYMDHGQGEEYAFSVDEAVLVHMHLKKGLEINKPEIEEIIAEDNSKKALNQAIQYLSYRMRSEKEIKEHLYEKGYDDDAVQKAFTHLKKYNYTNDLEFAKAYVRTKMNTSNKGPELIRRELIQKGITEEDLDTALLQFTKELQLESSRAIADKLLKKKSKLSKNELLQQLGQAFMSKGFPKSIADETIKHLEITDQDSEWEAVMYQAQKAHRRYSKYTGWDYEKRMKQFLYRKGFPLTLIDKVITELNS